MKRAYLAIAALLISTSTWADPASPHTSSVTPSAAVDKKAETPAKRFMYIPKPTDIVVGKDNAPVTIVEYASLSCPHCAHFYNETMPTLKEEYITPGKVKLVYRDYPLNQSALQAALLVQCADKSRAEDFVRVLFKTQDKWAYGTDVKDALGNIAVLGGLDRTKFERCLVNNDMQKALIAVEKESSDDFKVGGTPTFFINGEEQKGDHSMATMAVAIDAALAKTAKK